MSLFVGDMAALFTEEFCREFGILPAMGTGESLHLLCSPDSDLAVLDYVRFRVGHLAAYERVSIDRWQAEFNSLFESGEFSMESSDTSANFLPGVGGQVDSIIHECLRNRASDIHFEPSESGLRCRVRIDGVLQERQTIPANQQAEAISRLKIMSGLDIAEKRRPQDGRIRFSYKNRLIDIRVSIIPTDFGEKVVLRLLDKQQLRLDLSQLGFQDDQLRLFKDRISVANGLILVTGPTGSGKTTTLYAALTHLKRPEVNISTVEDPIEYNLEGINQTHVRPDIGVSFAHMLRSLLRQDPNIIMVGEIRDRETLDMAIRASLTGHLVLSTVHTNSAVATITRLTDMGAEPYLLGSSLKLVIAQRLIRKNCPHCFTAELTADEEVAARDLGVQLSDHSGLSDGCSQCQQTGFQGRTAVYELVSIDEPWRHAITSQAGESHLRLLAKEAKIMTMMDSARQLIALGIVRPTEALRELRT